MRVAVLAAAAALVLPAAAEAGPLSRHGFVPLSTALTGHAYALVAVSDGVGARVLLHAAGGERIAPDLGIWRLPTPAARRLIPRLRRLGVLRYAEPDRAQLPAGHLTAGDPLAAPETAWHLYRVGADRVEPPGPGVPISVIDSGLDLTHLEFRARPNTVSLNPQPTRPWESPLYHGTLVSSVAAAPTDGQGTVGIYPQAVLRSYAVDTAFDIPLTGDVIRGMYRAITAGRTVLNVSLSGGRFSRSEYEAVIAAVRSGSLVVAAAGNEFQQGSPVGFPATLPHVLTVAATGATDAPTLFSSESQAIDLAAPGERVPVQHPSDPAQFRLVSGTSFSAPIVAAAGAWIWTARPDLTNDQLADVLRLSARDVWTTGYDSRTGFGLLDIPAALARPPRAPDQLEPNDDIDQVAPGRLFRSGQPAVVTRARRSARIVARLDEIEDPADVYRLQVPGRRTLTVTVAGNANVGTNLWRSRTRTVYARDAAAARNRLATSNRPGKRAERLVYRNPTRGPVTVYFDVWLAKNAARRASYTASIMTR
ncbi:MAG: S8 family serine peptidase [Thermoleophilia bacterium]|nr:S8 family serine peptidase [Thermoleophilia bacterium]